MVEVVGSLRKKQAIERREAWPCKCVVSNWETLRGLDRWSKARNPALLRMAEGKRWILVEKRPGRRLAESVE